MTLDAIQPARTLLQPARRLAAPGCCCLALAAVVLFFRAPLLGDLQFYHSDVHALIYPLKEQIARDLNAAKMPSWDPSSLCGYPIIASYIFGVFLPHNLLFMLMPFAWAFKVWVVLKHLLAALFQFLLLRRLGASPAIAAFGAAAFALTGPLLSLSDFHTFSFECLPLACWLWWRVVDGPGGSRLRGWLASVLGMTFVFVHGDLQTLLAGGVLALFLPLVTTAYGRVGFGRSAVLWVAMGVATALLGAVQLLPSLELLAGSTRSSLPEAERMAHSLAPAALAELVWPDNQASVASTDFVAFKYLGLIVVGTGLLGVALVAARRDPPWKMVVFFVATLLVSILLALGHHMPFLGPLSMLPGFDLLRYPQKWLGVAAFATTLVFALGLREISRRGWRRTALTLGWIAVADLFLAGTPFLEGRLVEATAFDSGVLPDLEKRVPGYSRHHRVLRLPTNGALANERLANDSGPATRARAIAWNIQSLLGNNAARADARRLSGISSVSLRSVEELWREAARREKIGLVADLMAARWVLTTPADAERFLASGGRPAGLLPSGTEAARWKTSLGELAVHARPTALERAVVVPAARRATSSREALDALFADGFDPRREVVVTGAGVTGGDDPGEGEEPTASDVEAPEVRFAVDDAERLVLDVQHAGAGGAYLLLNDSFDKGWHARVNGEERPVLRANLFARCVRLPAGDSRVEFVYRPRSLLLGAIASSVTLLLLALVAGVALWKQRL